MKNYEINNLLRYVGILF